MNPDSVKRFLISIPVKFKVQIVQKNLKYIQGVSEKKSLRDGFPYDLHYFMTTLLFKKKS